MRIFKAISIIFGILLVLLGIAYFLNLFPWSQSKSNQSPIPTSSPTLPISTSSPTPSQSVVPPASGNVDFDFVVTDVTGSGFSRTITAQLTNTGQSDAHNTWAQIEVFSGTSKINVNGQSQLIVNIGTIKAGQTIQQPITISFSVTDGLKILQNGATFQVTIHSDEYTKSFSYDYKP